MDKGWGNNELLNWYQDLNLWLNITLTVIGVLTNNYVENLFCYLFILGTIQLYTTTDQNKGITSQSWQVTYIINCKNESDKSVILCILYSQLNL